MKHKLSQWHDENTKPKRTGVYQVKTKEFGNWVYWSFWNGKAWGMAVLSQDKVHIFKHHVTCFQNKKWRGIVK